MTGTTKIVASVNALPLLAPAAVTIRRGNFGAVRTTFEGARPDNSVMLDMACDIRSALDNANAPDDADATIKYSGSRLFEIEIVWRVRPAHYLVLIIDPAEEQAYVDDIDEDRQPFGWGKIIPAPGNTISEKVAAAMQYCLSRKWQELTIKPY